MAIRDAMSMHQWQRHTRAVVRCATGGQVRGNAHFPESLWFKSGRFDRVRPLLDNPKEAVMLRAGWLGRCALWSALGASACLLVLAAAPAAAAPPWATLVPFKKTDADPKKSYDLQERQGPWMIMAASFAGPTAEQQARDLVLELRQRYQLDAYTYRQTYDFSKPTEGRGYSPDGSPRRMRYLNNYKFDEIAVIVGNFGSIDDPQLDKTLDRIKHLRPDALDPTKRRDSSQRFLGLRTIYALVSTNPANKTKGPMGAAFVTRNPLLPEEYFVAKGLDPFVVEMNQDLPHSLLNCPGRYSVRVATFRGVDTMKPAEFEKLTTKPRKMAKIDEAALKATNLCAALRQKGVEAYEFHDRTESMVTIGSFAEVGQPRPDGKIEINPAIHALMQQYGPVEQMVPGKSVAQVYARTLNGIAFDPQPIPVEVPKQSVGTAYNATSSLR